MRPSQIQHPW